MAEYQWLDDESHLQKIVLNELDARARGLFAQVSTLTCGCRLLRFLEANANKLMTVDDIAYHLIEPYTTVARALYALVDLGLAREVEAAGLFLYSVTADPVQRQLVCDLCAWQDRWHARLVGIERVINGMAAQ